MPQEKIKTGADWRLTRLRGMLSYIKLKQGKQGVTTTDIKAYMSMRYGLKFKTSAEYLEECHVGGLVTEVSGNRWMVTGKYENLRKLIYSE